MALSPVQMDDMSLFIILFPRQPHWSLCYSVNWALLPPVYRQRNRLRRAPGRIHEPSYLSLDDGEARGLVLTQRKAGTDPLP